MGHLDVDGTLGCGWVVELSVDLLPGCPPRRGSLGRLPRSSAAARSSPVGKERSSTYSTTAATNDYVKPLSKSSTTHRISLGQTGRFELLLTAIF